MLLPPGCPVQSLPQIGDQILRVFDSYRIPNQSLRNARRHSLLFCRFYVARGRRRSGNGFYCAEIRGQICVAQAR